MGLRSPLPRILFFYEKSIQKRIKEEVSSLISPRAENLSESFEEWNNRSILGDNDTKLYFSTIYNIVSPPQSLRDVPPPFITKTSTSASKKNICPVSRYYNQKSILKKKVFFLKAHIQPNQVPTRRSHKKRLLKILTSRLFIVGVLILVQLFLLLFLLVKVGTMRYWISIVFNVVSILMVLYILTREDNPSFKISWIIVIMAVPLIGGVFYLIFGRKMHGRRMARQIESYTDALLHKDHGSLPQCSGNCQTLERLRENHYTLARQADYIYNVSGFELYQNTEAEYFPSGEQFFARLLEELRGAQKFILLEYFIVQHGKMWDSILKILENKRAHGVEVRILYDDVGCVATLPALYADYLRQKGFQVGVFNPFRPRLNAATNYRDHRKICVIDGNVGFTGGINLADEYINQKEKYGHWKDTAVLLRGEAVQSLTEMFLELWQFTCHESLSLSDFLPTRSHSCAGFVQPYGDSPLDNFNLAENVYMQILNHAKNYVYITTPYLILDNEMINALCLAAQSGIDVRIITPHVPDKWYVHMVTRSHYSQLLRAGIRIFEYTPGFIHAKMFVSDDSTAIVGTTNVDFRSFYLHFECGVAFYLSPMVSKVKEDFLRTQNICEEITLEKERAVKAPIRILRSLLRAFAPLM